MKNREKDYKFASFSELIKKTEEDLGYSSESQVMEIPIKELYEFKNHPFRVLDDEKMDETVESVKSNGVLVPAIVRIRPEGGYELISGHRRRRACELAGLDTMPVIVRNLTDEEATIIMVDANIQRETLLISEKAKAYSMKYQAEKRQGKSGGYLLEEMCEQYGESRKQIQRFIWISRLLPELLEYVDEGKLGFTQGVDISFLSEEQQAWVLLVVKIGCINVSIKQSEAIKKMAQDNKLSFEIVQEILQKPVTINRKLSLNEKKLSRYFDNTYTSESIEELIIKLLEQWKESNSNGNTQE